jgi:hypothetical protein
MSVVKLVIPSFSHKVVTSFKMEVGYIPRIAMVNTKNNGTLQIDITTPNITPFLSNLKVENPRFSGLVGTCPILLGDVNVPVGTILPNINHWGKCT